jgi:hypothetical protein
MADILDDATRAMVRASRIAGDATSFLREAMYAAQDAGQQAVAAHYRSAYMAALRVERDANQRVVAALVNPAKVARLTDATDELERRLERLRQSEAELDEAAQALGFLSGIIGLLI